MCAFLQMYAFLPFTDTAGLLLCGDSGRRQYIFQNQDCEFV